MDGTTVADGWVGAVMQNHLPFNNVLGQLRDRQTGQWTTNGQTKPMMLIENLGLETNRKFKARLKRDK